MPRPKLNDEDLMACIDNKNPIEGPFDAVAFFAVFLICVGTVLGMVGGILIGRHTAPRQEHLEPANIDLLKDAAAIKGKGKET